mgnify:CR=1 FL=1
MPFEFLKDASYWLEAEKMERFLEASDKLLAGYELDKGSFIEDLAAQSAQLRAWGVLDGVLRMLPKPQDIFAQPERFISYFISPAPPIANILREDNAMSFMLPISKDEYPLSLSYLKTAMEYLPSFMDREPFQVEWEGNTMRIAWKNQEDLFAEDPGHMMKPELVRSLASSLEQSQVDLENKNKELMLKNTELENAKNALEKTLSQLNVPHDAKLEALYVPLSFMQTNIHRLQDYMSRSQQLITLLVGQGRKDKQVKEAMHRVDWDYVMKEYPNLINDVYETIDKIRAIAERLQRQEQSAKSDNLELNIQ